MDEQKEAQKAAEQVFPNQHKPGRMALQIFALLVLLGLASYGVYAWKNTQITTLNNQISELKKQVNALQDASSSATDQYKTYTTKYEKLSFDYPSTVKIVETDTPGGDNLDPGSETVTITTPTGLSLKISNGATGVGGACPDCKSAKIETINLFNSNSYLNYVDQGDGTVYSAIVTTTKDSFFSGQYNSRNIKLKSSGDPTLNLYEFSFLDSDGAPLKKSLADFTGDKTMPDLIKVLESFRY